jgi:hypothetical protein
MASACTFFRALRKSPQKPLNLPKRFRALKNFFSWQKFVGLFLKKNQKSAEIGVGGLKLPGLYYNH